MQGATETGGLKRGVHKSRIIRMDNPGETLHSKRGQDAQGLVGSGKARQAGAGCVGKGRCGCRGLMSADAGGGWGQ